MLSGTLATTLFSLASRFASWLFVFEYSVRGSDLLTPAGFCSPLSTAPDPFFCFLFSPCNLPPTHNSALFAVTEAPIGD